MRRRPPAPDHPTRRERPGSVASIGPGEAGAGHGREGREGARARPRRGRRGRPARDRAGHTGPGLSVRMARLAPGHRAPVRAILEETGLFRSSEVVDALEVFDAALGTGSKDYSLLGAFAEDGALLGYACYGPTPGTEGTWDLYWIAVAPDAQRRGIGSALWRAIEPVLRRSGARLCVVETSGRGDYRATRRFYDRLGFRRIARTPDFYADGEARVTYAKRLASL